MSEKFSLKEIYDFNVSEYDLKFYEKDIKSSYVLEIASKKYLINYDFSINDILNSNYVAYTDYSNVFILSVETGEVVFMSGLNGSFVAVDSFEFDILVISDFSVFLINKERLFPWGYKSIYDWIINYKKTSNDYEILLELATEESITMKLNIE